MRAIVRAGRPARHCPLTGTVRRTDTLCPTFCANVRNSCRDGLARNVKKQCAAWGEPMKSYLALIVCLFACSNQFAAQNSPPDPSDGGVQETGAESGDLDAGTV